MSDIGQKSIGTLIDELCTTSQKLFQLQDKIIASPDVDVPAMTRNLMSLNARRSALVRAIDERLGEGEISQTSKTYR